MVAEFRGTVKARRDRQRLDEAKFRELLLYIASKCEDDLSFGATRLNKILYYADFGAYRRLGRAITGDEYQHLPDGPAPRRLVPIRNALLGDGSAEIRHVQVYYGVQQQLVPKRAPNLALFDGGEIAIVDEVIQALWRFDNRQVSDKSHEEFGWRVTGEYETIPYRTAWLGSGPLTFEQIEKGLEVAERHGLLEPAGAELRR